MALVIGLTGGIGCGKSTVSSFFSDLDISTVDADLIARLVVSKGQPALKQIADHFGKDILIDGALNRSLLRDIIFKDESQKVWLNNLLHPLIHSEIIRLLAQANGPYVLLEAPLLFENRLDRLTDYNLVVDLDPALQIKRASARDGVSAESIKAIISSQIDRQQRLQKADFVIDNNGVSLGKLKSAVIDLDRRFKTLEKKLK
ncbi:MAG: dephospho-CoA kinase [Psychromonas sp.]|jgi:dephospho-CoA kinase|uniref:dephospho-CoA kinase n=1 Tax=Psychromonas sp. TaxID=1884585 RepID=UPI0039E643CB